MSGSPNDQRQRRVCSAPGERVDKQIKDADNAGADGTVFVVQGFFSIKGGK